MLKTKATQGRDKPVPTATRDERFVRALLDEADGTAERRRRAEREELERKQAPRTQDVRPYSYD